VTNRKISPIETLQKTLFAVLFFHFLALGQFSIASTDVAHALWSELQLSDGSCNVQLKKEGAFALETEKRVDTAITDRVSLIHANREKLSLQDGRHPQILSPDHLRKIDVTNALFLQYGQNIILESKTEVLVAANKLIDNWKVQWRTQMNDWYAQRLNQFNKFKQDSLRAGTALELVEARRGIFALAQFDHEPLFPMFNELVQDASQLDEKISQFSANFQSRFKTRIATGANFSISEEKEYEVALQVERIKFAVQADLDHLKEVGNDVSGNFAERAAAFGIVNSPTNIPGQMKDWASFLSVNANVVAKDWFAQAPSDLNKILETLRKQFPVDEKTGNKGVVEQIEVMKNITENFRLYTLGKVFSADGLTLQIPTSKIWAQYNLNLATTVLTSEQAVADKNPAYPILLNIHGAGTTRSTGQSFKALNPIYNSFGFSPYAIDMPVAGLGPAFSGTGETISFLKKVSQEIRSNYTRDSSKFLIYNGRSSGAYQILIDNLMDPHQRNADIYVGVSLSNPETIGVQLTNVQNQLRAGLFSGAIQEPLEICTQFAERSLQILAAAKKANPNVFQVSGVRVLLKQGTGDADGGPNALPDLQNFIKGTGELSVTVNNAVKSVAPLAMIRVYEMPAVQRDAYRRMLAGEEVWIDTVDRSGKPVKRKVTEDMLEGTHFIDSNSEDYPGFSYPRAQMVQSTADTWLQIDLLADGVGEHHTWPDADDRLAQARAIQMRNGMLAGTPYHSLFERYVAAQKINFDEVNAFVNPKQNTGNYVERLANSKMVAAQHKEYVTKYLRDLGLL
jgi:hypothetical protein